MIIPENIFTNSIIQLRWYLETHIHVTTINEKRAMNLKENKEGVDGGKGRKMYLYYKSKNKSKK